MTDLIDKVKKWTEVSGKMAVLKEVEGELRKEIAAHILSTKIKGSKKGVIGPYILTATAKLNTKVDRDALKVLWPDLSPVEKAAIKFDPKVVAAKYKLVDENSILNQVLINKPGMPGLELKGVKETSLPENQKTLMEKAQERTDRNLGLIN